MNCNQLFKAFANSVAAARRVLKHQERVARRLWHAIKDLIYRFCNALYARLNTSAKV